MPEVEVEVWDVLFCFALLSLRGQPTPRMMLDANILMQWEQGTGVVFWSFITETGQHEPGPCKFQLPFILSAPMWFPFPCGMFHGCLQILFFGLEPSKKNLDMVTI